MPTETAQILATCFSIQQLEKAPLRKDGMFRSHFNPNHPSCKYPRQSIGNFQWILNHGLQLCYEYKYRYKIDHFQLDFLKWCQSNIEISNIQKIDTLFDVPLAMPDKYKIFSEDYKCYRAYINGEKEYSRWPSIEKIPSWFKDRSEKYVDKNFVNGSYIKR